jgi:two-component system, cell cycle response regulator
MTAALSQRSDTFQHAALTDAADGHAEPALFRRRAARVSGGLRKIGKPVGLMILDLDHFKQINDTHGHDVGDMVLREVADCLRATTRYHDVVARLGGEEFAVVVPNMNEDELVDFADRMRNAVSA